MPGVDRKDGEHTCYEGCECQGQKTSEMSDEELTHAVAEEVTGWVSRNTHYWGADEIGRVWAIMPIKKWQPLTDANHWMMVVEKMVELGFTLRLGYGNTIQGVLAWVRFEVESYASYSHNKNPGRAVCKAALAAVRGGERR